MTGPLFISYRRSHQAGALGVKAMLETAGLHVWLDLDEIDTDRTLLAEHLLWFSECDLGRLDSD